MQFSAVTLALAFGSANAFMGQPLNTRSARSAAVKMTTQEELAELAESNYRYINPKTFFYKFNRC